MAIYIENEEIVAARIGLLVAVILFGVPGNFISIILNFKSFKNNCLNGVAYLHLATVDFCLCLIHALLGMILECVGYYSLRNDMGSWGPFLTFLAREIGLRVHFIASFASASALTFLALLRCWRIFNPFGVPRKNILICCIFSIDIAGILLSALLKIPRRYLDSLGTINGTSVYFNKSDCVSCSNTTIVNAQTLNVLENDTSLLASASYGETKTTNFNFSMSVLIWTALCALFIILTAYCLICVKLCSEFKRFSSSENKQDKNFIQRQAKHFITHIVLCVTTVICIMPSIIFAKYDNLPLALQRLLTTVGVVNSAVNPYIYCILIRSNRRKIREIFRSSTKSRTTEFT